MRSFSFGMFQYPRRLGLRPRPTKEVTTLTHSPSLDLGIGGKAMREGGNKGWKEEKEDGMEVEKKVRKEVLSLLNEKPWLYP